MKGKSADVFLPSPYTNYCRSEVPLGLCEFRCRSQLVYLSYVPRSSAHQPWLLTPTSKFVQSPAVNLPCMASLSASTSKVPSLVTAALENRPYTLRGTPISSKLPVVSPTPQPKLPPHRFYKCTSKRFPWRRSVPRSGKQHLRALGYVVIGCAISSV